MPELDIFFFLVIDREYFKVIFFFSLSSKLRFYYTEIGKNSTHDSNK